MIYVASIALYAVCTVALCVIWYRVGLRDGKRRERDVTDERIEALSREAHKHMAIIYEQAKRMRWKNYVSN